MKGILGRKLGMTQVFDAETGTLTPVTVIAAGPCPVVAVRTAEADGYDAVQLGFGEAKDKALTKALFAAAGLPQVPYRVLPLLET